MKKILLLVLALLVMWSLQRSAAQMPTDPEEPPRLKKKKQKSEMPDPPVAPEKKPDPADEDKLDPRSTTPGPVQDTDEQELLRRLARNSRSAEERLLNRELGDGIRQIQDDILKDLDALIAQQSQPPPSQGGGQAQNEQEKQENKQQKQGGTGNQEKDPTGGTKPQGGTSSQPSLPNDKGGTQEQISRREQRKQREKEQSQSAQRPQQGSGQGGGTQQSPGNTQNPGSTQSNPMNTGNDNKPTASTPPKPLDPRYDIWGHLTEAERLKMNRYMDEKFMDKYDELTRQYYRTIAEKSRRKGN